MQYLCTDLAVFPDYQQTLVSFRTSSGIMAEVMSIQNETMNQFQQKENNYGYS